MISEIVCYYVSRVICTCFHNIKMQNVMRGRMARKQVNQKRALRQRQHEQAAALKIQSVQRGKKGRQKYKMKVQSKSHSRLMATNLVWGLE